MRAPSAPISSVANPCRCVSLPGESCSAAGSTSMKPSRLEIAAQPLRACARPRTRSRRPAVGMAVAAPERARRRSPGVAARDLRRGESTIGSDLVFGGEIAMLRAAFAQAIGTAHISAPNSGNSSESYRQLDPQGQHHRARGRPALRRSVRRKLLPRQGHADDADRHAPPLRRRQGDRPLQDHRAGRARLRRGQEIRLSLFRRRRLSLHEHRELTSRSRCPTT